MALFRKKEAVPQEPMDLDAVMKKYDQESNVRLWEGAPKIVVDVVLRLFSLFCIYVTLWGTMLEERRLTSFLGLIIVMGFLCFPAKKGVQKVNHIPWYDILAMILGVWSMYTKCTEKNHLPEPRKNYLFPSHLFRRPSVNWKKIWVIRFFSGEEKRLSQPILVKNT